MIKPSDVYETANDIVSFAKNTEVSEQDRVKILKMCRDYYNDKNETIIDQWLYQLTNRTIDKFFPETDFEKRNDD